MTYLRETRLNIFSKPLNYLSCFSNKVVSPNSSGTTIQQLHRPTEPEPNSPTGFNAPRTTGLDESGTTGQERPGTYDQERFHRNRFFKQHSTH
jgi:hypothetical protein